MVLPRPAAALSTAPRCTGAAPVRVVGRESPRPTTSARRLGDLSVACPTRHAVEQGLGCRFRTVAVGRLECAGRIPVLVGVLYPASVQVERSGHTHVVRATLEVDALSRLARTCSVEDVAV